MQETLDICEARLMMQAPQNAQIDMAIAQEHMRPETDFLCLGGGWLGIAPERDWMDRAVELLNLLMMEDEVDSR